jgi:VWFA-related protein
VNRFRRAFLIATAGLICAPIFVISQTSSQTTEPTPSFKVEANAVVIDVIVNKKGKHIPGLTANDFVISEDGVPQKIVSLGEASTVVLREVPVSAAASAMGKSETVAPATPVPATRMLTVVMDLANSHPDNLRKACRAALDYLEKNLHTNDYVAIYSVDRGLRLDQPFTNDMVKARAALDSLGNKLVTSALTTSGRTQVQQQIRDLYAAAHPAAAFGVDGSPAVVNAGRGEAPGNTLGPMQDREIKTLQSYLTTQNTIQAKATFVALRAIALSYADIPGRKNLVLFSEGFLYSDEARSQMEGVAEAANRANVAFYVIDPSGLNMEQDMLGHSANNELSQMVAVANETAPGVGGNSGGMTKFDKARNIGDNTRNEQLGYIADVTGGLLVRNMNDLLPAFTKVVEDSRNFYSISYVPTNKEFDGKFRKLKLEVAQKGLEVRYRKGYWAIPRGQPIAMTPAAAQMLAMLQSGGFKSAFVPDVYAKLLMAPDGHFAIPVSVSFDGSRVPLEKTDKGFKSTVTLLLVARDDNGRITGIRQSDWPVLVDLQKKDEFQKRELTLQTEVVVNALAPVNLDVIVSLPNSVVATAQGKVELGPPSADGLQLSSLMLTTQAQQATCPDNSDPLCFGNVRLIAPPRARFTADQRMIVYFAATGLTLDPQTKQPRVAADMELRSGSTIVPAAAQNLQALPGPTPESVLIIAEFDLKALAKGKYSVNAVAHDLLKKSSTTGESEFSIQ